MTLKTSLSIIALGSLVAVPAAAQDSGAYVSLSGGLSFMTNSAHNGELTSEFVTGEGTTIPGGVALPAGTSVGWDTGYDNGFALSGAFGYKYDNGFRSEIELAWSKNDVDTHTAITVGGGGIGTQDAGLLITGSENLGVLTRDLIAAGEGKSKNFAFMGNVYYDLDLDSTITPYVGAGIGYVSNKIVYAPSGVGIANDSDGSFAWQLIAGADFKISETMSIFADYKYRVADRSSINLDLIPANLKVENKTSTVSLGVKFGF